MKILIELDPNDCRWPSGERDITFHCSAPKYLYVFQGKLRQSSYCREHHFRCTTVTSERAVA